MQEACFCLSASELYIPYLGVRESEREARGLLCECPTSCLGASMRLSAQETSPCAAKSMVLLGCCLVVAHTHHYTLWLHCSSLWSALSWHNSSSSRSRERRSFGLADANPHPQCVCIPPLVTQDCRQAGRLCFCCLCLFAVSAAAVSSVTASLQRGIHMGGLTT